MKPISAKKAIAACDKIFKSEGLNVSPLNNGTLEVISDAQKHADHFPIFLTKKCLSALKIYSNITLKKNS